MMTRQSKANSSRPLTWGVVRAARDSNPNRQIRSLVLCVDLVGSSRIWPAHVGCLVGPDGSRRILSDRLDDQTDDQAPWSLPRHSRRHVGPGHKILNLVVDPHEGHESHQSADAVSLDALTDVLTVPAVASGSVRRPGGIDRREFGGQPSDHLGQQQLPEGGL